MLGKLLGWGGLVGLAALWVVAAPERAAHGQATAGEQGPLLYQQNCASCHGNSGQGTFRGPTLVGVGGASADFYLRSGRMPIDDPSAEVRRREPAFDDAQIRELVDYVAGLEDGPEIPAVDVAAADLARGGELYRLNCAACHNWDGKGGALTNRENAPPLHAAPPVQVAESIRIGPGTMPEFGVDTLSDADVEDIVAYVEYLKDPDDAGGFGLAHWGPATEALAAAVGLGGLLLLTGWLGKRQ